MLVLLLVRNEKQEAQTWRGWVEGADGPFPSRYLTVLGSDIALDVKAMTVCAS